MSQFYGMIIEDVRQLATQLNGAADEIQQLISTLGQKIEGTSWAGPDHDRFVSDWHGPHTQQLTGVMNALREASQLAQQNAAQQEQASV